jgi:ketosteroid isomerase-like protein
MSELAERFMTALHRLEAERDVEAMSALFEQGATLRRAPRERAYEGPDGARRFWSEYLDAFQSVKTEFGDVTEQAGRVVLEWRSTAISKVGHSIEYDGCSIVEGEDERVRSFRTYYDAASAGMGAAVPSAASEGAAKRSDES